MEMIYEGIPTIAHKIVQPRPSGTNTLLMSFRQLINRLLIVGFLFLIGFCLARAIEYKSVTGILLALTSLGATVYFLYLLANAKAEMETEESA